MLWPRKRPRILSRPLCHFPILTTSLPSTAYLPINRMAVSPQLALYALVFLAICLVGYGRTLWFGKKYRVPVAVCYVLNSGSLIAIILLGVACWETRTWKSFGFLAGAAGLYLWTSVWENNLKRRQKEEL